MLLLARAPRPSLCATCSRISAYIGGTVTFFHKPYDIDLQRYRLQVDMARKYGRSYRGDTPIKLRQVKYDRHICEPYLFFVCAGMGLNMDKYGFTYRKSIFGEAC
jgi:hypothetical protein